MVSWFTRYAFVPFARSEVEVLEDAVETVESMEPVRAIIGRESPAEDLRASTGVGFAEEEAMVGELGGEEATVDKVGAVMFL